MVLPLFLSMLGSGMAQAGVLGAAGSFLANPVVAGAIGSGLGTALQTGDVKKGLMSGLGSFAGGTALGKMFPGAAGAGGSTAQATNSVSGPMSTSMRPMARPENLGAPMGIIPAAMQFSGTPAGIGTLMGGALAGSLSMPGSGGGSGGSGSQGPAFNSVPAMRRTAATPPPGYVPGRSPEFNYNVSTPYTTDYVNKYAAPGMRRGGPVRQRMVPGMGPVRMQAGGIAELGATPTTGGVAGPATMNQKEIITQAIAAIRGKHPDPQRILGVFLAEFGEQALRDLVDKVQPGPGLGSPRPNGKVQGPGDGMSDMVPASVNGEQDVLLSDGEYVVPADVVSGLGNGSTDAGAKMLDDMADEVRLQRTGSKKQAPAIKAAKAMPA